MFFEPTGLPLGFASFIAPSGIFLSGLFVSNLVPLRDVVLDLGPRDNDLSSLVPDPDDLPLDSAVVTLGGGASHD